MLRIQTNAYLEILVRVQLIDSVASSLFTPPRYRRLIAELRVELGRCNLLQCCVVLSVGVRQPHQLVQVLQQQQPRRPPRQQSSRVGRQRAQAQLDAGGFGQQGQSCSHRLLLPDLPRLCKRGALQPKHHRQRWQKYQLDWASALSMVCGS